MYTGSARCTCCACGSLSTAGDCHCTKPCVSRVMSTVGNHYNTVQPGAAGSTPASLHSHGFPIHGTQIVNLPNYGSGFPTSQHWCMGLEGGWKTCACRDTRPPVATLRRHCRRSSSQALWDAPTHALTGRASPARRPHQPHAREAASGRRQYLDVPVRSPRCAALSARALPPQALLYPVQRVGRASVFTEMRGAVCQSSATASAAI